MPGAGGLTPKTFAPLSPPIGELPRHDSRSSTDALSEDAEGLSSVVARPFGERVKKKAAEHAEKKEAAKNKEQESVYSMHVGTGAAFHRTGRSGLDRKLAMTVRQNRASYSGVSADDQKLLGDIIGEHAHHLSTGSKIGYTARRQMKESVRAAWKEGKITQTDIEKFNKIIGELH